jgi:hypothetical protein
MAAGTMVNTGVFAEQEVEPAFFPRGSEDRALNGGSGVTTGHLTAVFDSCSCLERALCQPPQILPQQAKLYRQ